MAPRTGTDERYATQLGELWNVLTLTLWRLDELAAEPERLDDESAPDVLRRLQYGLHMAAERVYGLAPPGTEPAHVELWSALAGARDATAEVAEMLEEQGVEAVGFLLHEWRGALFRVRLARMRLATPEPPRALRDDARRQFRPQVVACVLVLCGAAAFALGAMEGHWPVWAAGMLAVCGSMVAYRP